MSSDVGIRSAAGASVHLPSSEKYSVIISQTVKLLQKLTTKRSIMGSLNFMERQKMKAMKVVEKMVIIQMQLIINRSNNNSSGS